MKKHFFTILLIITSFLLLPQTTKASFGDLRYEVTEIIANGDKITINGWAFIHRTNNYITVYKNNVNKEENKIVTDGGQQVKIIAKLNDTEIVKDNKVVRGTNGWVDYNFYYQHFTQKQGDTLDIIEGVYNNGIDGKGDHNNKCNETYYLSQCYYQDVYFSVTFDLSKYKLQNINNLSFEIAVTNNSFNKKINDVNEVKGKSTIVNYKNKLWVKEDMIVTDATKISTENSNYEITKEYNNEVEFIAEQAVLQKSKEYGCTGEEYTVCGKNDNNTTSIFSKTGIKNGGSICIKTGSIYNNCYHPGNSSKDDAFATWVKPTGYFSLKIEVPKKCDVDDPKNKKLECNNSLKLASTCDELTIKANDGNNITIADVKINEIGTLTNVLTPKTIFSGGGIKYGVIYYNTLSWKINSLNCINNNGNKCNGNNIINKQMENRIKKIEDFKKSIKIDKATFGGTNIEGLSITCEEIRNIDYKASENSLTTICTIFLPKSELEEYTGKVKYGEGEDKGINNKYYTPQNKNGSYLMFMSLQGLNRLSDKSLIDDSAENGTKWTGDWKITTTENDACKVNLYDKKHEGKDYAYRPININDPFPNRNAGANWYEWYKISNNKKRLEDSYNESKLEYQVKLDAKKIRKYNEDKAVENYLSWHGMYKDINNKDRSSFIDDEKMNFCIKRGEGDCS